MKPHALRVAFLTGLMLIGLSACTTPQANYRPIPKNVSFPELNSVVTVNVGDEMLKQGTYVEGEAIRLNSRIKFGFVGYYTMTPGVYDKVGENKDQEFYQPAFGREGGTVEKALLSDPWKSIVYHKDGSRIGIVTVFHAHVKEKAVGVTKFMKPVLAENSFQQTLIYSGKVGSKVRLGYREFSSSTARPAFNNDVDYDLDQSKVIGYKGARIEIVDATNESITYKVIQNFKPVEI